MTSVPRRRRLSSHDDRIAFGDPSASMPGPGFAGTMPHFVAASGTEAAPDERFVVPLAVNRGGVEERDSQVDCPMDRADRLIVVAGAIRLGHAHASEPDRGHEWTPGSQLPFLHRIYLQLTGPHTRASHCGMIVG